MTELTKEDFAIEAYWTLWNLWDELPIDIDSDSDTEFIQLPDSVKTAVAEDWNDKNTVLRGVNIATHYNYMMMRLGELKEEVTGS